MIDYEKIAEAAVGMADFASELRELCGRYSKKLEDTIKMAGRKEEYAMKLKAIAVNLIRSAVILGISALGLPFCDGDGTYFIFMLFICTAMVIGADYDDK